MRRRILEIVFLKFLNIQRFFTYPELTQCFGSNTKAALIKFQKQQNITPAEGYFRTITRGVVNGR